MSNTHRPHHTIRKRAQPLPAGAGTRLAAALILEKILHNQQSTDAAFASACREAKLPLPLPPADRALVMDMVLGCLRHHGLLEAILRHYCPKPFAEGQRLANYIGWCGIYQLVLAGMPPHAVVNTAVDAAKNHPSAQGMAKLLNAVLRRVAGDRAAPPWQAPEDALAQLPEWLTSRLLASYGRETLQQWQKLWQQEAPLFLTAKTPDYDWPAVEGATPLPTGIARISNQSPAGMANWAGYAEGDWWVQDAAASLPVWLMGRMHKQKILEVGAAPGGKTAQMRSQGAYVVALDRSKKRMEQLKQNFRRLKLDAEYVVADALDYTPSLSFDRIVMDAPCSATGTIRRHPDLPYIKTEKDIAELTALQASLLKRASGWLKPGNELWYITCSLLPEEGEAQITKLLAENPAIKRKPFTPDQMPAGLEAAITTDGDIRTLPHHWLEYGGMDGFFIARLIHS